MLLGRVWTARVDGRASLQGGAATKAQSGESWPESMDLDFGQLVPLSRVSIGRVAAENETRSESKTNNANRR